MRFSATFTNIIWYCQSFYERENIFFTSWEEMLSRAFQILQFFWKKDIKYNFLKKKLQE